jgi:glycolate oxidase FAD binding subunit
MPDCSNEIVSTIQDAFHEKSKLQLCAGSTKQFYGRSINAKPISLAEHTGIIEYEPSELYLTARSGTLLSEIEDEVAAQNQILPCEPPYYGSTATLGGTIACGLAGPRRVSDGDVRDCILGSEIINGKGEKLRFGGKVMKNVAGYDVSRLMCGALGTLGIIMTVSMRLLPKPEKEQTIALSVDYETALNKLNRWANTPLPITASFYDGNELFVRLSSSESAIDACKKSIGGELTDTKHLLWNNIKEHQHNFFNTQKPLWRISVPPNTQKLNLPGNNVMEWNGALRWYSCEADAETIRTEVERAGGHATLFKGDITDQIFHPLSKPSMKIHKKLKHVFDPAGILNPEKMFAGI